MIKTAFGTCSLAKVPLSFRLLAETNSGWLSFRVWQNSQSTRKKSEGTLDISRQPRLPCRARQNESLPKRMLEKAFEPADSSGVKLIFDNLVDEF